MTYAAQNIAPVHSVPRPGVPGGRVVLVRGKDYTGARAWYFLRLLTLRVAPFEKAAMSGLGFDLDQYGEVVASGYGDVPEQVRQRMKTQYGWSN
jgi:hypothetical protein